MLVLTLSSCHHDFYHRFNSSCSVTKLVVKLMVAVSHLKKGKRKVKTTHLSHLDFPSTTLIFMNSCRNIYKRVAFILAPLMWTLTIRSLQIFFWEFFNLSKFEERLEKNSEVIFSKCYYSFKNNF